MIWSAIVFAIFYSTLIFSISFFFGSWITHFLITRDSNKPRGYGNYKKFKTEFDSAPVLWYKTKYFGSLFAQDIMSSEKSVLDPLYDQFKIHASVFTFQGKNMIFKNPLSYLLVAFFVHKYIFKLKRQSKIKTKPFTW